MSFSTTSSSSPSTVVNYPLLGDSKHTVFADLTELNLQFLQMASLDRQPGMGGRSLKKSASLRHQSTPLANAAPLRKILSSSSKPIEITADSCIDLETIEMVNELQSRTDQMWELMRKNSPRDAFDRDTASCLSTDNGRTDTADDNVNDSDSDSNDDDASHEWEDPMFSFYDDEDFHSRQASTSIDSRSQSANSVTCDPLPIETLLIERVEEDSTSDCEDADDEDIFGMEL